MFKTVLALGMLVGPATAAVAATCAGADPAIVSVRPSLANTDAGQVNHYRVAVVVKNLGSAKQAGNVLDSVVMYQNGGKTDVKGLQPLAPGRAQTVVFTFKRSADAVAGATHLRFQIQFKAPVPPGAMDCNLKNDEHAVDV